MNPRLQNLCCALTFVVVSSSTAAAQLINVRTAPVNVSEQFYTFPARWLGMGGGIAVRDLEADPFSNPAAAARISGTIFSSTPTLYRMSGSSGFGRTLPVSAMGTSPNASSVFLGASLAAQQLESAFTPSFQNLNGVPRTSRFADNYYAFGLIGKRLPRDNGALAFSTSYANIDHLHMVDLLYPEAAAIQQGGSIVDSRLGYIRDFGNQRSIEAVLVRDAVDMHETVTYVSQIFVPNVGWTNPTTRQELNADRTTTWGAHAAYRAAVAQSNWRVATYLTANFKAHPKIPNYNFSHLARDPGNTQAYALGVGVVNEDTASMLAFDFAYTPMWTNTWAEAATSTRTASGNILAVGSPTVENAFVFSNYEMHAGWAHKFDQLWVQLGVDVLSVHYALDQYDDVLEIQRNLDDSWSEGTFSWGLALQAGRMQLRYFGHVRGNASGGGNRAVLVTIPEPTDGGDIVSAPTGGGASFMSPNKVVAHQIGIAIPVGR